MAHKKSYRIVNFSIFNNVGITFYAATQRNFIVVTHEKGILIRKNEEQIDNLKQNCSIKLSEKTTILKTQKIQR
jgi:hypothetical protein